MVMMQISDLRGHSLSVAAIPSPYLLRVWSLDLPTSPSAINPAHPLDPTRHVLWSGACRHGGYGDGRDLFRR
jgi:hypothetical protein